MFIRASNVQYLGAVIKVIPSGVNDVEYSRVFYPTIFIEINYLWTNLNIIKHVKK